MNIHKNKVLINGEEYDVEHIEPTVIIEKAEEHYNGTYLGTWGLGDVFKAHDPDRDLGHKDYFMLRSAYNPFTEDTRLMISGMEEEGMSKKSKQAGAACHHCKTVIWSSHRHDYHGCKCEDRDKQIFVDGGLDYLRMGFAKNADYTMVTIDHINKTITKRTE